MCLMLNAFGSAAALGLGPTFLMMLSVAFCSIAFYFAQWEEYVRLSLPLTQLITIIAYGNLELRKWILRRN